MQGQNYSFYNNNSMTDMNQSGQGGSNKQGKNKIISTIKEIQIKTAKII